MGASLNKGKIYKKKIYTSYQQACDWHNYTILSEEDLWLHNILTTLFKLDEDDEYEEVINEMKILTEEKEEEEEDLRMSCRNLGVQEAISVVWEAFKFGRG